MIKFVLPNISCFNGLSYQELNLGNESSYFFHTLMVYATIHDICQKIVYFHKGRLLCWKFMLSKSDHTARLVLGTAILHILGILNMKKQQKAYIIKEYLQV